MRCLVFFMFLIGAVCLVTQGLYGIIYESHLTAAEESDGCSAYVVQGGTAFCVESHFRKNGLLSSKKLPEDAEAKLVSQLPEVDSANDGIVYSILYIVILVIEGIILLDLGFFMAWIVLDKILRLNEGAIVIVLEYDDDVDDDDDRP